MFKIEKEVLEKYKGKLVTLFLTNRFQYSKVMFQINEAGLIEFSDRFGGKIEIEPEFIYGVMELKQQ